MTWSILDIFIAYLVGHWLGLSGVRVVVGVVVGVVVLGALLLIPTFLEVLRYFGFSVSGGDMTWSNLIIFGLSLVAYPLGLRAAAKRLLDPDRLK
jgi:hypothetical protein